MGATLRLVRVKVRDVLGADEVAIQPGKVTMVEGRNGVGKTSILDAIQAALGPGASLARIARVPKVGEEPPEDGYSPEVVLVLDGEGEHHEVVRDADDLKVKHRIGKSAAFETERKPADFLRGIFDGQGANPIRFLQADTKTRFLMLLNSLPIPEEAAVEALDRVASAAGGLRHGRAWDDFTLPASAHPLEAIDMLREHVFNRRQGVNRDKLAKGKAAEQNLRETPAEVPEDLSAEIETLRGAIHKMGERLGAQEAAASTTESAALKAADVALRAATDSVNQILDTAVARKRREHNDEVAKLKANLERRIANMKDELVAEEARMQREAQADIATARSSAEAEKEKAREVRASALSGLVAERERMAKEREALARWEAQQGQRTAALALRKVADQFQAEADALAEQSERLTSALDAVDAYRRELAAAIPIEGLTIKDKTILIGGVPLDQVNRAQFWRVAVKIAMLRANPRLPLVFFDGAEALDEENLGALVEELKASPAQAFIAAVTRGPLSVRPLS